MQQALIVVATATDGSEVLVMANNGTVAVAASEPSTVLWRLPPPLLSQKYVPFTHAVASPKNGLVFLASNLFDPAYGVGALRRRRAGGRRPVEAGAYAKATPSVAMIQAVDALTGEERWQMKLPSFVSALVSIRILGASQDRIAVSYMTTDIVVLQLSASTGTIMRNISLSLSPLHTYTWFIGMADEAGDLALVVHVNDIIAFDTASGDERWRLTAPHEPFADIGNGRALITAWDKTYEIATAIMVNATTGAVLWKKPSVGEIDSVVMRPTPLPATMGALLL